MTRQVYIVIPNWDGPDGFQHYRDRDPIWIKNYVRLMSHDDYLDLSYHQRGILHGLWMEYARSNRQLPGSTVTLTRRLGHRVTTRDLEALNEAGFIQFVASKTLAERYHSRAPAHSREAETEAETELKKQPYLATGNGTPTVPIEIDKLITAVNASGREITAVKNAARGLPESSIAKVCESVRRQKRKLDNPIGYAIAGLQKERAEHRHIRELAHQSLALNEPLPGEPV